MKRIVIVAAVICTSLATTAQSKPADTVIVDLGKSSKVVFTMKDRSDIEILKQYDFQALFTDILTRLKNDTAKMVVAVDTPKTDTIERNIIVEETWDKEDDDDEWDDRKYRHHRTRHSFNFDFGTNNYLEEGKFPDNNGSLYAIRPWGSWYIGMNSVLRTQVTNKFFIEWGTGISWYNFKFQDDNVLMLQDSTGVYFETDTREASFKKSRLMVCYINASIVPMFDFGGNNRKSRWWDSHNSAFRIGVGPYIGYRIDSSHKLVYKDDGEKEKDKEKDDFYINNMRYGIRMQIGVRSADFFFNYDLNELFVENKGPKLNAFSFGVIF